MVNLKISSITNSERIVRERWIIGASSASSASCFCLLYIKYTSRVWWVYIYMYYLILLALLVLLTPEYCVFAVNCGS